MKFSCDTCHARYTIADEKVRGKILRVRCKKCGSSIVLKEPEEEPVEQQPVREDDATHVLKAEDIKRVLASPGAVAPAPIVSRSVQPESPRPPPAPTERPEWYILIQKEEIGPLRIDELRERASSGRVTPRTYIWRDGMANWARLQTVPELAEVLKLIPESQQRPTVPPPPSPLTSAVFTPAAVTRMTPVPALAGMVPLEGAAETAVSSTEVTPKDLFEKTILAPTAEARLVPAPAIDPSTLKTEVGTPSQEQTLPADPPQETAPPEETAPQETAPPERQPEPSTAATQPPFEAPETPEDDAPVLFGLDRNQVPVLAEAFKEPTQSDWDAQPEAAPETIPSPPPTAAAPLPSVMVDLGPGSDAFQTVRVYPSGNSTNIEIPGDAVARVGRIAEKSAVPAPAHASPVEHSASFVEALRPRTGRRVLAIAIPLAIVPILVGVYWMFGREPAKPAPVSREFAGPPRPSGPLPVAAVEPPPKPKKAAPEEPSEPEAAPAPRPAPKVMSAEEAAFAAVQGDKNDRKLAIPTPAFLSHDDQELNTEAASAEIDEDLLARKVKQIYPAIQHCVTSEQHRNQNFKPGKVKVTIEIAKSGSVSEVSFDKQAVADAGIGDCLRLAFKTIKMPPHEGEPANVEIPLFLQ